MKALGNAVIALLAMTLGQTSVAHRLDEYLQATLIGVTRDAIDIEVQLTPGVAMLPALLFVLDVNQDGRFSLEEERAYADRVAKDLKLTVDGVPARLSLVESTFPSLDSMQEGLGTIRIKLRTERTGHVLRFENRHLPQLSVYLVNCLAAPEAGLVVTRQARDPAQKSIKLNYFFGSARADTPRRETKIFLPVAGGFALVALTATNVYRWRSAGKGGTGRAGGI